MNRLISFKKLRESCTYVDDCDYEPWCLYGEIEDDTSSCTAKNCPIWTKLRRTA